MTHPTRVVPMGLRQSFSSSTRYGSQLWGAIQVELHGDYPAQHIQEFDEYARRTSWQRALLVCLLTPLPAVLLVLVADSLPIEDPSTHTAATSPRVWLRLFFTAFVGSTCVLEQFRQHVPSLYVSRKTMPLISILGALTASGCGYLLANGYGYPFPFTMNAVTLPWFTVVIACMLFGARHQLLANPELRANLMRHQLVCACQIALTMIYPLYNTAFVSLGPWEQTAFVFVLPLIKIVAKNWISYFLLNTDEARPESVVFNVEVFHALFVSFSMQSSTATHTVLALMAVDFIQAWLSFVDVNEIAAKLQPISRKLPHALTDLVRLACVVVECEPLQAKPVVREEEANRQWIQTLRQSTAKLRRVLSSKKIQASRLSKDLSPVAMPSVSQTPQHTIQKAESKPKDTSMAAQDDTKRTASTGKPLPEELLALTAEERGILVRNTQKLLFVTEFVALVEYTEVIIPLIFNQYILIMFYLPNRQYYDFLHGLTDAQLRSQMNTIFLYALLELVSLVTMGVLLWRKLRLSLLHQIAFVLEKRQASIQAKVLLWVTDVMQSAIRQFGVDYSFKFAWLHASHQGVRT